MAFPREGSEPVCLDMATTSIPWNRVMNARREGGAIAPGVAVDADGHDTTDAQQASALRPLGGPTTATGLRPRARGGAAVRPAARQPLGPRIGPMYAELERPRRLGAFFVVLDPQRFAGGPAFAATVEQIARALAAEPGAPKMPGDPEREAEVWRRAEGIPSNPASPPRCARGATGSV